MTLQHVALCTCSLVTQHSWQHVECGFLDCFSLLSCTASLLCLPHCQSQMPPGDKKKLLELRDSAQKRGDAEAYIGYQLLSSLFKKVEQFARYTRGTLQPGINGATPFITTAARRELRQQLSEAFALHGTWAKAVLVVKGYDITKLPATGVVGLFKSCNFRVHEDKDVEVSLCNTGPVS
jgi:hypothetical protein